MRIRKAKTQEGRFISFLSSLDNIWTKLIVIGSFVFAGFKFGCFYKETQMKAEQIVTDKAEWLITAHYVDSLRSANYQLQKENAILLNKVEKVPNKRSNYEK